ncbi:hypothetical protein K449DRAFT_382122 [Hypoxylon sp. EC38]|nr:hypothetical protein K449DRAFT_382122 [Hypoxylon sp. EC38]
MDFDSLAFDLDGDGQGGYFRVRMANRPGEINRPVMVNRGDKFQVLADLLDVAHGTTKDGGDDATLIIANFSFLPSSERRFKNAQITWTFISDDPAIEVEVANIAPVGSWSLVPTTRADERSIMGKVDVGPSAGPVAANGGAEYTMKQTQDRDFHTEVTGSRRVHERDTGGPDTARWNLRENPTQETGIARSLQVGLLLKRTVLPGMVPQSSPPPTFRGTLEVVAEKDWWSQRASEVKRVWKKTETDDAIVFRPGEDRVSGFFDIDKNNLDGIHLRDDVMFMSLHESFESLQEERKARKKQKEERQREEGN